MDRKKYKDTREKLYRISNDLLDLIYEDDNENYHDLCSEFEWLFKTIDRIEDELSEDS